MFIIPITLQAILVETEIIQSKGGSQVINIPITGQTFTQLVITSKGYLIKFNSDSSRSESNLIEGLQFSGVKSDGCQISNDLIVIANADDKQLIFFNLTNNAIATDTIENFSDNGLSLSCSSNYFVIATSSGEEATIKLYHQKTQYKTNTISKVKNNHITCTLFKSKIYTVCFYPYSDDLKDSNYSLFNENLEKIIEEDVQNIHMEHEKNAGVETKNHGVISKRIEDNKVIYCETKLKFGESYFFFCNIGELNISNSKPLNLASENDNNYAVFNYITNKIEQCFIGVRSDNLFSAICRFSFSGEVASDAVSLIAVLSYSNNKIEFLSSNGQSINGGQIKILKSPSNTIINIMEFNNNAIGYLLSDETNTVMSIYYPKCSNSFANSFNYKITSDGTCISDSNSNGYYYDSFTHQYVKLPDNVASCSRLGDFSLKCECDMPTYYPIPADYEGSEICWNKDEDHNYYYFDSTLKMFKNCYQGCLTCSKYGISISDTKCKKCDNWNNLSTTNNYYYSLPTSTSISDSSNAISPDSNLVCYDKDQNIEGYYYKDKTSGFALCHTSCKYCSNSSTSPSTLCQKCKELYYPIINDNPPNLHCYYYQNGIDGYYLDGDDRVFKPCHQSCKKCEKEYMEDDTTENKCTECATNYYKLANNDNTIPSPNFSCIKLTSKPSNTFFNSNDGIIYYCNVACNSCSSISSSQSEPKCNSCSNGYYPLETDSSICINEMIKDDFFSDYFFDAENQIYRKCNIECEKCSNANNLCDICSNNYYKLEGTDYCYSEETKESNFIFDATTTPPVYKLCYEHCERCDESGTSDDNKCLSCISGYIMHPTKIGQCILECESNQYYYIDNNNNYICVDSCPSDYPNVDISLKRCFDDCINDNFKYTYENQCVDSCPEGTIVGISQVCQDGSNCKKTNYKIKTQLIAIEESIPNIINTYMETSSTNQDVSIISHTQKAYEIIIYKNESCINDIKKEINFPNLNECINKIKTANGIPDNTLVTVFLLSLSSSPQIEYQIYNSETKIELSKEPCKDLSININILIPEEIKDNLTLAQNMLDKYNINVYDINDPFFTDVCYEFTAENGKDIILEDRIKVYFQNFSLCEKGCTLNELNIENMTANCNCDVKLEFLTNVLDNSVTGDILEMANDANIKVVKCYKNVFDFGHFIKNIGSYIMLICIITQIPFLISYIINGLSNIRVKLFTYFRDNPPIKNGNNIINDNNSEILIKKNDNELSKNHKDNNINDNDNYKDNDNEYNNDNDNDNNNEYNNDNDNNLENGIRPNVNDDNFIFRGTPTPVKKNQIPNKLTLMAINNNYFDDEEPNSLDFSKSNYSFSSSIKSNSKIKKSSFDTTKTNYKSPNIFNLKKRNKKPINKISLNPKEKKQISEELSTYEEDEEEDLNSMQLYDALIFDKRTFCQFYWEQLQEKQDIIRTFCNNNPYEVYPIKVMTFIFGIGIFFTFNGIFYSESYISERYWTKKENFMFFLKHQITKCFYSSICVVIINSLVEFLASSKKDIERLIKKKKNPQKFQNEIFKVLKAMKRNFLIFIILDFIILFFSWYYLSAFCNVYKNSQMNFLQGCAITFCFIQIYPFLLCLFVTCLRFLGLKYKFETAYKLSVCLTD